MHIIMLVFNNINMLFRHYFITFSPFHHKTHVYSALIRFFKLYWACFALVSSNKLKPKTYICVLYMWDIICHWATFMALENLFSSWKQGYGRTNIKSALLLTKEKFLTISKHVTSELFLCQKQVKNPGLLAELNLLALDGDSLWILEHVWGRQ